MNATFHNLPSESTVRTWAEQTPPGFRFATKLSRVIADGGRVERAATFCERVRLLGERLGPILVQLERPRDEGFLRLLRDSLDPDLRYVWELRHPSWEGVEGLQRIDDEGGDEPFRYFRLRGAPYDAAALAAVAARLRPLLDDGLDVYCYVNKGDAADHSPGGEPTAATALRLLAALRPS